MLSTDQKSNLLYKHTMGVADTRSNRDFYEEAIKSSFCVRPEQLLMYGDEIPKGTEGEAVEKIRQLAIAGGGYYDYQKDETTVIHVVEYHKDVQLEPVDIGTDNSFKLVDGNGNIYQNIIPFNYSGDLYNYQLTTSEGKKIYFGVGDWVLDTYSGVLTFYGKVPKGVDHKNPPKISFYQYVGGTGFRQDTFGFDGVIMPITNWNISKGTYLIDTANTLADETLISLETKVSESADKVQEGYVGTFGFDGNDKNEGIAYSLQPIVSLRYTQNKDKVMGYDESDNSEIGTLLSKTSCKTPKGLVEALNVTFATNNLSNGEAGKENKIIIESNTIRLNDGKTKTFGANSTIKLSDGLGNFIVVDTLDITKSFDGEYILEFEPCETRGILLYWDIIAQEYLPFKTNESNNYDFGFPLVAANGRIPPSVSLGTVLNSYSDSITPEYYGPRNYSVTIALDGEKDIKSADYIVKNKLGYYLNDIFERIIIDYTSKEDGKLHFNGTVFIRAGEYQLDRDLDLRSFTNINILGENISNTKIIGGDILLGSSEFGISTINELTIEGISFNSETQYLFINRLIGKNFRGTKSKNLLTIKNSSFNAIDIDGTVTLEENESPFIYTSIIGSTIGQVTVKSGYTLYSADTIGTLNLFDVPNDVVRACFINTVNNKPHQTNLFESTVITYNGTAFTEIPHMAHFPIFAKTSDRVLEYATFADPFEIDYKEDGNFIRLKIDDHFFYLLEDGRLSIHIDSSQISVDTSKFERDDDYTGLSPAEAIPNGTLEEALKDLYGTKADLNPNGKVPLEQLPDSVSYGGLLLVGTWSFEYKDEEHGKPEEGYYVDGGNYPTYEDCKKNLTEDQTQEGIIQPGWFMIVESSKKNIDYPAAIQKSVDGIEFTAGDWVICAGRHEKEVVTPEGETVKEYEYVWEKLDRAYQDVAYMVLPVYTTGEHLSWSWRDSGDTGDKWGLGALALGGETIAESFDMVNQELRKLWVKHPAILSNVKLEPVVDYDTLNYYKMGNNSNIEPTLSTSFDLHKDNRIYNFTVCTPESKPRWKSSIFVGDNCTFETSVDGSTETINYIPNEGYFSDTVNIPKAFDPFDEEISGSNYWKAAYINFKGIEPIKAGSHSYLLSMKDIAPNNNFTKDAICSTGVYRMTVVKPFDLTTDESFAKINVNRTMNTNELLGELDYCSGIRALTKSFTFKLSFSIEDAIDDFINIDRYIVTFIDNSTGNRVLIPEGNLKFIKNEESGFYSIIVSDFEYSFMSESALEGISFSVGVYDVYKNLKVLDGLYNIPLWCVLGTNEKERVCSGYGMTPTFNTLSNIACGYPFDSSKNLKKENINELQKVGRNYENDIIFEYKEPDGKYWVIQDFTDYTNTITGDETVVADEKWRWATFSKFWEDDSWKDVILHEASGFTLEFDVNPDKLDKWGIDDYTVSTNNLIIQAKVVDTSKENAQSITSWINCNIPYDGFAEVGKEDNQAGMYAGSSNEIRKRVTFGKDVYSGNLIIRVGIKMGSGLSFKHISIKDII